ncbi:MAG TPA: glycerophosphodiester phosphodiesterase family protein [Kofleriaceae bacterium]|nr:glycerophosphodiester phosphodiesterase family protein [Kofleriaceae bacterium]
MKRRTYCTAGGLALVVIYAANASCLARPDVARPRLLAHRGVHQTFACPDLDADTCTAACLVPPTTDLLENTIASMRAAFALGADVVELDIHPTTDGELAVFHDWRLECRTNGSGVTREHSMRELQQLDIGYGYTADGGKTFPFRGKGIGLMPTLDQVLDTFPDRRFLIDIKSNEPGDGDALARALLARPAAQRARLMVYGGDRPVERVLALVPELRGLTKARIKACVVRYEAIGWTGHVPDACRHAVLVLPRARARWLWGWPHRFIARMAAVDTDVFVVRGDGAYGFDDAAAFDEAADDSYSGGIWTDRIEVVGPAARRASP